MSWFQKLKAGLQRSSNRLVEGINRALGRKRCMECRPVCIQGLPRLLPCSRGIMRRPRQC